MKKTKKLLRILLLPSIMLLLILHISAIIEGVQKALALCAYSIIPSLFVFLVLSDLIAGLLLSESSISPKWSIFLLGSLCGFPVGALACDRFCNEGALEEKEAAKLAAVCNAASPAFVIGAIGNTLFHDKTIGILLFLAQCLVTLLLVLPIRVKAVLLPQKTTFALKNQFFLSLEKAIKSILQICALICLFSAGLALCKEFLHGTAFLFLSVLTEIGNGVSAASTQEKSIAIALCGFACGWSGICVHFQIFSCIKSMKVNKIQFVLRKFLQGILTATAAFSGYKLFLLLNF